jgi:integrase
LEIPTPNSEKENLSDWKGRFAPGLKATTRMRTISDLKAALNFAHRAHRKQLPSDFAEVVQAGLAREAGAVPSTSGAREKHILADEVVRRIVAAAGSFDEDGDVGQMVLVLAATGARFSQVQRITVGDVQVDRLRIFVPTSRKGQGRVAEHYAMPVGADAIAALAPVVEGRSPEEPLLCRWRYVEVKGREWRRDRRGPWTSASELTRPWKVICEQLKLKDVVPYALRHSSIVRGIRSGLPIRLVAAMHDTSVAMIERHYARYIVEGLEELAARAVVPLTGSTSA